METDNIYYQFFNLENQGYMRYIFDFFNKTKVKCFDRINRDAFKLTSLCLMLFFLPHLVSGQNNNDKEGIEIEPFEKMIVFNEKNLLPPHALKSNNKVMWKLNQIENEENLLRRSEWMKGKYGLMVHWLSPNFDKTKTNRTPLPQKGEYKSDLNEAVNGFDVDRFLNDFDQTGAEWLIFTIGQNSGTYASPNSIIDSLTGKGHTSERDLVLEIAKGIKKRGKRFIAYLPCEIKNNETMHEGFRWNSQPDTDQSEFQYLYLKAVREWAVRFGKNLDGWWFDGCYSNHPAFDNKYMRWDEWYDAARAGNNDAVLAFNDGSYLVSSINPIKPVHDYLSGEQLVIIDGKLRIGLKREGYELYLPESDYIEGTECLNHTLLAIDAYWGHGWGMFPNWANFPFHSIHSSTPDGMEPPVYSDEELQQFVKNYTQIGGAVTLNTGIFQEGHLGKLTIEQLRKLKENYLKWEKNQ